MNLGLLRITKAAVVPTAAGKRLHNYRGAEVKVLMICEDAPTGASPAAFSTPNIAVEFWRDNVERAAWFDPEKECVVVLCLDQKNNLKIWNLVSLGNVSETTVHPREVFRPAIVASASAIILMHNHPSGDPTPSDADVQVTDLIRSAGRFIGIRLIDHIIVGTTARDPVGRGWFSYALKHGSAWQETV